MHFALWQLADWLPPRFISEIHITKVFVPTPNSTTNPNPDLKPNSNPNHNPNPNQTPTPNSNPNPNSNPKSKLNPNYNPNPKSIPSWKFNFDPQKDPQENAAWIHINVACVCLKVQTELQPYMSIFGLTKGYSLFSVEHLMILTVRGQHRKPIIDFPTGHNHFVFEGRGSYALISCWGIR